MSKVKCDVSSIHGGGTVFQAVKMINHSSLKIDFIWRGNFRFFCTFSNFESCSCSYLLSVKKSNCKKNIGNLMKATVLLCSVAYL